MRIIALFITLCLSQIIFAQNNRETTKYFRHLRYNHVSPFIQYSGVYPIDKTTAESTSHYIFKYDNFNRLTTIVNNHYFREKQHPLASTGVYALNIEYLKNTSIHTFYDINGNRMVNNRKVFKEVYHFKNRKLHKMVYFDLEDSPMESNWNIATYNWSKKGNMIVEKRYNLKGEKVFLSPYFKFSTTGIVLNKKGQPKAHYNLNNDLQIANNVLGIASYLDTYDIDENHISYSYQDEKGNLVLNRSKFAIGKKVYDSIGNHIEIIRFDTKENEILRFPVPTNTKIQLAKAATNKDSVAIHQKSLDYLVALQQVKPKLLFSAMNDSLNKITIGYDRKSKNEYARSITKSKLIETATEWNRANNRLSTTPNNKVIILDIYNRIATVKLVSENWVEYLHFIKLDGKWSVANLLWQHKNINRYPKE